MSSKHILNENIELIKSLRCVRCGTYEDIKIYEHFVVKKSRSGFPKKTSYYSKQYNIPTCPICYQLFSRHHKFHAWLPSILLMLLVIPAVLVSFFNLSNDLYTNLTIYYFAPMFFAIILSIILPRFSSKNIKRYVKATWRRLKIKDPELKRKIHFDQWVEKVNADRYGVRLEPKKYDEISLNNYYISIVGGNILFTIAVILYTIGTFIQITPKNPKWIDYGRQRFLFSLLSVILSFLGYMIVNRAIKRRNEADQKNILRNISLVIIILGSWFIFLSVFNVIIDLQAILDSPGQALSFFFIEGILSIFVFMFGIIVYRNGYRIRIRT